MQSKRIDGGGYVFLGTIKHGQNKPGVDEGPHALRKRCKFPSNVQVVDPMSKGEQLSLLAEQFKLSTNQQVPILNPTAVGKANLDLHQSIMEQTISFLDERGCLPSILTLGGDHSLAIGSISAIAAIGAQAATIGGSLNLPFSSPELVVIWVDAHADINTPSVTCSGKLHGCPVSLLTGLDQQGWKELRHFDWAYNSLPTGYSSFVRPESLAYIGLRDVDQAEKEILAEKGIIAYDMEAVKAADRDMRRIIRDCLKRADPTGTRPIHLSFDIDAIDPRYAPSTGTPVADGLLPTEGKLIIEELKATGRLISMDLVEVNPGLGDAEEVSRTLATAKELIETYYQ